MQRSLGFGVLLTLLACWGCDDGPPPPPPPTSDAGSDAGGDPIDAGPPDGGATADAVPGPRTVRCIAPEPGAVDYTREAGTTFRLSVLVSDDPEASPIDSVTVNGEPVTLDEDGLDVLTETVEHGIHTYEITATNEAGGVTDVACSFLFAGDELDGTASVPGSVVLQLNTEAIDDGVDDDGLDSLNDLVVTGLSGGLLDDGIDDRFTGALGPVIKPSGCDLTDPSPMGSTCALTTEVEYMASTSSGIEGALSPTSTGLRFVGLARSVDLSVRARGDERITSSDFSTSPASIGAAGSLNTTGTLTLSQLGFGVELRVFTDAAGALVVELADVELAAVVDGSAVFPTLDNTTITSSYPEVSGESLRSLVEDAAADHVTGMSGRSLRETVAEEIGRAIARVLQQLFRAVSVRSLPMTFASPTATGGSTSVTFSSAFRDAVAATDGLTFVLDAAYAADTAASVRDIDLMPISGATLPPASRAEAAGHLVHQDLVNALNFNTWRAGGLNGVLEPGAVEPPAGTTLSLPIEMASFTYADVTAPDEASIQLDTRLPPVVRALGTGLEIQLGEVVATVTPNDVMAPGSWPATQLTIGATFAASPTGMGTDPSWHTFVLTRFAVGVDRAMTPDERTNARRYAAMLALHLARHQLEATSPALPIGSVQLPVGFNALGLPGLDVLGSATPTFGVVEGGLEATGAFGNVP